MLKKLLLLGTLVFLAVLVVGGWFGYQAWVHVSRAASIQGRQADVVAKWLMNPDLVKKAATGKGGITVSGLDQDWRHDGVTRIDAYAVTGNVLKVRYAESGCHNWPYTYDMKRMNDVLSIIVYVNQPWMPDFEELWLKATGRWACGASVTITWMRIPMDVPVSGEAIVDGATGKSVGLYP